MICILNWDTENDELQKWANEQFASDQLSVNREGRILQLFGSLFQQSVTLSTMATHVFWSPFVIPLTSKFHQTNNTKMILTKELVAKFLFWTQRRGPKIQYLTFLSEAPQ